MNESTQIITKVTFFQPDSSFENRKTRNASAAAKIK
jgi:hypothetical protein